MKIANIQKEIITALAKGKSIGYSNIDSKYFIINELGTILYFIDPKDFYLDSGKLREFDKNIVSRFVSSVDYVEGKILGIEFLGDIECYVFGSENPETRVYVNRKNLKHFENFSVQFRDDNPGINPVKILENDKVVGIAMPIKSSK